MYSSSSRNDLSQPEFQVQVLTPSTESIGNYNHSMARHNNKMTKKTVIKEMKINELINYLFSNIAVTVRDDGLLSPDALDQDGVFSGYFYSLNRNTLFLICYSRFYQA